MSFSDTSMAFIQSNISKFRKYKGFTQQQLADIIGLSRSGLADIESGKNNVYADTLLKISNALHVPITSFFSLPAPSSEPEISFRFLKRIAAIEVFSEPQKKRILKKLDDLIIFYSKRNETPLPLYLSDKPE
jgi:transcriptional regulator with XRE-family HTH domain